MNRIGSFIIGACLLIGVSAPTLIAQESENPLLTAIRSQLKDATKPFTLVIQLRVKPGSNTALEAVFADAIKLTRKEKGCLAYDLNRPLKDVQPYVVYERWANLDSIKNHLNSAHIVKLLQELGSVTEGPPDMAVLIPASE